MADTSAIDAAVIGRLLADATLRTLMPDGVYWDVASKNATRFVIVSQVFHEDTDTMSGPTFEGITYLVKGVELTTQGSNIIAAASRIHALLQDAAFPVTGYQLLRCTRRMRIRYTEVDEVDNDQRWQHRGGQYFVHVAT